VTDLERFYRQGHVNLIYKLFTVTLGYPLAEISRQIGAGPTGPTTPAETARRYTQEFGRPNYRRWARVQRALFLINRFSFRLALQGRETAEGQPGKYYSDDPLGRLTEANAWRCFLLHHWDFIEYGNAKPGNAPDPVGDLRRKAEQNGAPLITTDEAKQYINEKFQVSERTLENYDVAREYLRDQLQHLTDAWKRLNDAIDRCYQPGFSFDDLLRTDPEYRARWEELKEEGYLLTKPSWEAAPTGMNDSDAIERFTTRAKYVMVTVQAPGIHAASRMG
jgi:hypothetical protein